MEIATENGLESTLLFHQLDSYEWDQDPEFQGGLRAILGSVQDPDQVAHLTLRAKCYYFSRKAGAQVDFDAYKRWVEQRAQQHVDQSNVVARNVNTDANLYGSPMTTMATSIQSSQPPSVGNETHSSGGGDDLVVAEAPKPASFAEICEMIAEGKPIPGIKDIPNTILEGQASQSQKSTRKKPWEKDASTEENPSWMAS